jgi:hypothetical protein
VHVCDVPGNIKNHSFNNGVKGQVPFERFSGSARSLEASRSKARANFLESVRGSRKLFAKCTARIPEFNSSAFATQLQQQYNTMLGAPLSLNAEQNERRRSFLHSPFVRESEIRSSEQQICCRSQHVSGWLSPACTAATSNHGGRTYRLYSLSLN